jgi:predicted transposase YdaD
MPKIDIPVKRLFQQRPADWARYIQPGCRAEWVREFKTDFTPRKESRLDSVLEINDPEGLYLLNFEPMGYRDSSLPARMLRYRSDIWEATLNKGQGTPSIKQVVMFFSPDDDSKVQSLNDPGRLAYSYDVIRVWEDRRQSVIEAKLVGLYPLLPLMKGENEQETPEQVLRESIAIVQEVEDEALKQDLLAGMVIFAEGKFAKDLVKSLIRRDMVMQSTIFQEWAEEEGAKAKVEDICEYLDVKFGASSLDLQKQIMNISELNILKRIVSGIYKAGTIEEAQAVILGTKRQ